MPLEQRVQLTNNYEVVQTVGRTSNPRHFAESVESYQQFPERKGPEENVFNSTPVQVTSSFFNENFEGLSVDEVGTSNAGNPNQSGIWTNGLGSKDGNTPNNSRAFNCGTGTTPTGNTGPDHAHSGSKYIYTEVENSYFNKFFAFLNIP